MARSPGQLSGQAPAGLSWGDYVDQLIDAQGSLAAVAARLMALRGYEEDAESIERALRRLRVRGHRSGGAWGERVVLAFGVPRAAAARVRWMGTYHSRYADLPLPLAEDLLRVWDQPPLSEDPGSSAWLALAHLSLALRRGDSPAANQALARATAVIGRAEVGAKIERLLSAAFLASREEPARVGELLREVEELLAQPLDVPATQPRATEHGSSGSAEASVGERDDLACWYVRWIDTCAFELNRAGRHAEAEALYRAVPTEHATPFVLCRRANGLAYARWKQGAIAEGIELAREACRHAGDGGHLRLRAMALKMIARIAGAGAIAEEATARGLAIAARLEDEQLRMRFSSLNPK